MNREQQKAALLKTLKSLGVMGECPKCGNKDMDVRPIAGTQKGWEPYCPKCSNEEGE